jgi:OTU domain-containing protein 3
MLEVRGDGNCLFRAFSDQIEGSENNYSFYRQSAIDYMKGNEDHFKFFIEDDEPFEDYIKDMIKDGTWGGNLEIYVKYKQFIFHHNVL